MHLRTILVLLLLLVAGGRCAAAQQTGRAAPAGSDTVEVEQKGPEPDLETSHRKFLPYAGKPIARIRVRTREVFGASIEDTTGETKSRFTRFLNNLNFATRDATVRRNLLFREGDPLDPFRLADSERVLRNLPFLSDARILASSRRSPDSVDVVVVVREAWTLNLSGGLREQNGFRVSLAEKNFLGRGHGVSTAVTLMPNERRKVGYHAGYLVQNIRGSFITGELEYVNLPERESGGLSLSRELISPVLRYAGGLDLSRTRIEVAEDSLATVADNTSNLADFWAGRPLRLSAGGGKEIEQRRLLFFSARARHLDYTRRPPVTPETFRQYQNADHYLGSLAFIQSRFYRTNLLYNFGRTEDIPYGFLARITYGLADEEFARRSYAAVSVAAGRHDDRFGYGAGELRIGGNPGGGGLDRGVVRLKALYFSNLFHAGEYRFRQFVEGHYLTGIRREDDDFIDFRESESIRGITYNHRVKGTKRLLLKFETVSFTPWRLRGVSFALFTFADVDVVGTGGRRLLGQKYYSGLGLGLRLRKDGYGIGPLQLRFAWYPRLPIDHERYAFAAFGEQRFAPLEFLSTKPEIVEY